MPVPVSCEFGATRCRNSIEIVGGLREKCSHCRLAPGNESLSLHFWRSRMPNPADHPVLKEEKTQARIQKSVDAAAARRAKDRDKKKILRKAVSAESKTEKTLNVTATKNSGRSNKDGDHLAIGSITLDTKNQSGRSNPVVLISELMKVRQDAMRANQPIGGLVLRNQHGVGVVVFAEEDFAKILGHLVKETS